MKNVLETRVFRYLPVPLATWLPVCLVYFYHDALWSCKLVSQSDPSYDCVTADVL